MVPIWKSIVSILSLVTMVCCGCTTMAWNRAQDTNTTSAYEDFLKEYPNTEYSHMAKSRLMDLKLLRAKIVIDTPRVVMQEGGKSYTWNVKFREIGGEFGFKVHATEFFIVGRGDRMWSADWIPTADVCAGGSANVAITINDPSHDLARGQFHCIWIGEDDQGGQIRILQKVNLP